MRYHLSEDVPDNGYCDCGRYVMAVIEGYGPQTVVVWMDADYNQTCE